MTSEINEVGADGCKDMEDVNEEDGDSSKDDEKIIQEDVEEEMNETVEGEVIEDDNEEVEEMIMRSADEGTMTDINYDGKEKDGDKSAAEKKTLRSSSRRSFPNPLIKQIKQEVIEEIISNETSPGGKSTRRVANLTSKKMKLKREKLLGNSTDQSDTVDPPDTIDVTCGHLRGILHKELFYCPGIHRACVEIDDGTFVTPKRFMFMGEKARLKDWKNAIRWHGHQLRKHIEAGTLSFFKHEELCTGRCMARSPFATREQYVAAGGNLNKKEKFEFETLGFSPGADSMETNGIDAENLKYMTTVEENGCMKIQSVSGGDHTMWDNDDNSHSQDGNDEPPDIKPDVQQLQQQMMKSMQQKIDSLDRPQKAQTVTLTNSLPTVVQSAKYSQVKPYQVLKPAGGNSLLPPSIMNAVMPPVSINDSTQEEDRLLWQGIVELGLVDEFFREIKASLDLLKNTMVKRLVPIEDSNRISVIVRQLGLMQKLKFKLEAHRTDMDRQRRRLDREMMDLQRRVKEYEHKKKLLEKKSECFDQILEIPTMKNNSPVPMMVYPNQGPTPTSQSGTYILASPRSSNVSGAVVPANGVLPSPISSVSQPVTNMVSTGRITTGPGGSKILVFPKQSTEFYSSPEGGLKITLKRKPEFPSEESPAAKQNIGETRLKDILTKNLVSTQKTSENPIEIETSKEDTNNENDTDYNPVDIVDLDLPTDNCNSLQDEHNSSFEELNSSHEDNTSAYSGNGDHPSDDKEDNPLKRSKRKRSAKSFADYIK